MALQVNLLETKRSMNANIFLKQFKATNEEVVQMIKEGQQARIGAERLRGLQKIMPEKEEVRHSSSCRSVLIYIYSILCVRSCVRVEVAALGCPS